MMVQRLLLHLAPDWAFVYNGPYQRAAHTNTKLSISYYVGGVCMDGWWCYTAADAAAAAVAGAI